MNSGPELILGAYLVFGLSLDWITMIIWNIFKKSIYIALTIYQHTNLFLFFQKSTFRFWFFRSKSKIDFFSKSFSFLLLWGNFDIIEWFKIQNWEMVFCYQNCSDLLWEKIVLVIEKNFWNLRLKAKNLQKIWDH